MISVYDHNDESSMTMMIRMTMMAAETKGYKITDERQTKQYILDQ